MHLHLHFRFMCHLLNMLDGIVQKRTDIMKKHNYKYDVIRIVLTVLVVIELPW